MYSNNNNIGIRQWGTEVTTTNIREREWKKRPYWDVRYGNKIDLYVHKNERKNEAKKKQAKNNTDKEEEKQTEWKH